MINKKNRLTLILAFVCNGIVFCQQVINTSDYLDFLSRKSIDIDSSKKIFIFHFDFCSPKAYCNDTAKIKKLLKKLDFKKDILVVDTLYNSVVPTYVLEMGFKPIYVDRSALQRKGLYSESPLLINTRRTKIKVL